MWIVEGRVKLSLLGIGNKKSMDSERDALLGTSKDESGAAGRLDHFKNLARSGLY